MANIEKRIIRSRKTKFQVCNRLKAVPQQLSILHPISDVQKRASVNNLALSEEYYACDSQFSERKLRDLITRYQEEILPKKSAKPHLKRAQHKQLEWWKEQLGAYALSDVKASRIAEARGKLTCGNSTMNRYVSVLSHVFTIAICQWEWMDDNPVRKLIPLHEPRGRVRYLSPHERSLLLNCARVSRNRSLYPLIMLALCTGARKGELLNLKWSDIDFKRCRVVFQYTKNGERRGAPLSADVVKMLVEYGANNTKQSVYVFASNQDTPLCVDKAFKKLIKGAGITNFRFHDLRHTAASYLAMSGASVTDIAEVLGHKTLAMVKRYTHLSDTHTRKIIEQMNATLFANSQLDQLY